MAIKCVVIRLSNGDILNNNYEITEDIAQNGPAALGLDPDLAVLIKHEPHARPQPDFRYYTVQTAKTVTTNPHPTYPLFNTYETTYTTPKRQQEEIEEHAYNAEQSALNELFNPRDQIKLLALWLASVQRSVDNLNPTPKEQAVMDRGMNFALKIWNNDDNLKAKIAAIQAGDEPDLDEGWETEEA